MGRCRLEVGRALEGVGILPAVIDDALVVLGEMAANAVRHARTEFAVTATVRDGVIRFEVFDRDTRPPALLGLDVESTSGRGLHLVAGVATNWGWQTAEDQEGVSGKCVWAELGQGPETDGEPDG